MTLSGYGLGTADDVAAARVYASYVLHAHAGNGSSMLLNLMIITLLKLVLQLWHHRGLLKR
jgi:hypothetical protein